MVKGHYSTTSHEVAQGRQNRPCTKSLQRRQWKTMTGIAYADEGNN